MAGFDSYVKLLLHCNGTDGSTTFTDETGKTVSAFGTAQIDTAQSVFGGASGLFDGNSDYLTVPDSDDWYFGTGDFTIDCRVRFASTAVINAIAAQYADGSNRWYLRYRDDGIMQLYMESGASVRGHYTTSSSLGLSANTWYHVEVCRSGTTCKMFIDGVSKTLTEVTAFSTNDVGNISSPLYIGQRVSSPFDYFNGHIDELRISKGIARHTADFTPPTEEYNNITTAIKSVAGVSYASIKKVSGVAIASVKKIAGLS